MMRESSGRPAETRTGGRRAIAAGGAAVAVAGLLLAGCQSVDPATGRPKASAAVTRGATQALGNAAICGALTLIGGGSADKAIENAAICGIAGGIAGFAAGSEEDELDRQLLAEFRQAGLSVSIRGNAIVLNAAERIGFDQGQARPTARGRALLASVAKLVARFPQRRIEVVGHADASEPAGLAAARARAAAAIIAGAGIERERIVTSGMGATEPAAPTGTISAYRNRRVEIFFVPSP
jgi:outer membrane protein OmpA-like peptidoglycan-associated protein